MLGYSPDFASVANWAVGSALAGFAGILMAPITGLQVTEFTLLVLPALAAGIVGRMTSFPLTLLGGIVIGVTQSEIARYGAVGGLPAAVPFLLIVLMLTLRRSGVIVRSQGAVRLPGLGTGNVRPPVVFGLVAVTAILMALFLPEGWVVGTTIALAVGIVLLSVVVVVGYSGQLSLAQYALAGVGALASAIAINWYHMPFLFAIAIGVAAAIPLGLVLGGLALRTQGVNLAIATLGLSVALDALVFNEPRLVGEGTGINIGSPSLFGIDIDAITHPRSYALATLAAFLLAALAVANLRRSMTGRRLVATRANERAAASVGISVRGAKLYAFTFGGVLAAFGGIMLSSRSPIEVFTGFGPLESVHVIVLAVIGGVGWIAGAVIGGTAELGSVGTLLLQSLAPGSDRWLPFIAGILLLAVILQAPDGLAALHFDQARDLIWRFAKGRRKSEFESVSFDQGPPQRVRPAMLSARNVEVRFGGVVAVNRVSVQVQTGEVVGLIGPNGSGKTTLIDAITGYVRPSRGSILFGAESVDSWSATRRARAGLTRSFQSLELFEDMTVLDNLRTASDPIQNSSYVTDLIWPRTPPLARSSITAIHEFGLEADLAALPSELSYGRRRLVAIARTVATESSIVILDEPAAGLDQGETAELAELIRRLATDWGMGVLLIEHNVDLVMKVCSRIHVLNFGVEIAHGTPTEVRQNPEVIAAYLGSDDRSGQGVRSYTGSEARPAS